MWLSKILIDDPWSSTFKFADINSTRKSIYRERRKMLPSIPKSFNEAIAQISDLPGLSNK